MPAISTDRETKPWITLRHVAENGQQTDMVPQSFRPLVYSDAVQPHSRHRIEFTGQGTILKDDVPELTTASFSMDVAFHERFSIYALVEGGWLPLPFVEPGIFLIDQNVLITLAGIANGRIKPGNRDTWLTFLNNPRTVINPVFCAWEGISRQTPTYTEFCDRFDEASARISAALPKVSVIKFEKVHYEAAHTSILAFVERQERETEFLLYAVPLIREKTSPEKLAEYRSKLVTKATELGLNNRSLLAIAVFSCLFERQDGSGYLVGRKILKPKQHYTEQDAYNALCDLRSLELFICSRTIGGKPMSLCTRDRAMAAFWCLINPKSVLWENGSFTYSLEFSNDLFPRLAPAELRAFIRDLGV